MTRSAHVHFSHFRTEGAIFAALLPFSSPLATTFVPKLKVFGTKKSEEFCIYLVNDFAEVLGIAFKVEVIALNDQYPALVLFVYKLLVSFV